MKRATLALASVALLVSACGTPRKACRRAEGYIQKAVRICPESAQMRTDTVVVTVPGDSIRMVAAYPMPDRDSLRAVIAQLSEALRTERELQVIEGAGSNGVLKHNVYKALQRVRRQVCYHPPMIIENETARGTMWVDSAGVPHGTCYCKPQRRTATFITPQVVSGDVVVKGRSLWWVWVLIAALACACGYLYIRMDHYRYHFNRLNR